MAGTSQMVAARPYEMARLPNSFVQARGATGLGALNRVDKAALLLGRVGHVLEINSKAETLLQQRGSPLFIKAGMLRALDSASDRKLHALAVTATSPRFASSPRWSPLPVIVERPAGRPLMVEAVYLPDIIQPMAPNVYGMLLVTDFDWPSSTRQSSWATLFRLTAAEIRLCEALMDGKSLNEAAEALQITVGTARQRLKTVLHETETRRQGELILLLSKT